MTAPCVASSAGKYAAVIVRECMNYIRPGDERDFETLSLALRMRDRDVSQFHLRVSRKLSTPDGAEARRRDRIA